MSLLTIVFHFFFCTHLRPDGRGRVACSDCRKKKAEMKSAIREQQEIERQQQEIERQQQEIERQKIIQRQRLQEHDDHIHNLFITNYSVELRKYISDAYDFFIRPEILDEVNQYYNIRQKLFRPSNTSWKKECKDCSVLENQKIRMCFTHNFCAFSSEVMSALKSFQDDVNARYLSVFMFCNYRELLNKLEANKELRYYKLSSC